MAYSGTKFSTLEVGPIEDNSTLGNIGNVRLSKVVTFDPTSTAGAAETLFTLPAGSRLIDIKVISPPSDATNETVDIGTSSTADYFGAEVAIGGTGSALADDLLGAGAGTVLSEALTVTGNAGATAYSGAENVTLDFEYVLEPASVVDPSSY